MNTKAPIRRPSLPEQIKDLLVARIAEGTLRPGDRLIEMAIAKEVGTSQAPVREALRRLEALGLVVFRPNRGAVVRAFSEQDIAEVYAVRAQLEGYAVECVARDAPKTGAALLALCNAMDDTARAGRNTDFVQLNQNFHQLIVESCGNSTLAEMWQGLDVQSRTALNTSRSQSHLHGARAAHRDIALAVLRGDAVAARALLMDHIIAVVRAPEA